LAADNNLTHTINPMDLENGLRKIQPDRGNFFHRTAPFLAVHSATALWHIAMPVAGAVHSITTRPMNESWPTEIFQDCLHRTSCRERPRAARSTAGMAAIYMMHAEPVAPRRRRDYDFRVFA
jgi:hypothetical protein